jgi:hypothetical protein
MSAREDRLSGGAGLCSSAAHVLTARANWKEGVHGGTMGSPMLNREDALIMWKDPVREQASA